MMVQQHVRRIMVIDDSSTVRRIIEGTLLRDGFNVDSFADGLEAMQSLLRGATLVPDLVLLDIRLPQLDGYAVARLLRQKSEFSHTVIVMISSQDSIFDRLRGKMVGASAHITKPFKPGEVLEVVHQLLDHA